MCTGMHVEMLSVYIFTDVRNVLFEQSLQADNSALQFHIIARNKFLSKSFSI